MNDLLLLRLTRIAADRPWSAGRGARREFHIARAARERYRFDEGLYASSGNVIFRNLHAVRLFVERLNQERDLVSHPELAVTASQVNAMALIDEILHYVVHLYQEHSATRIFGEAIASLRRSMGRELDATLERFVATFPPLAVHRNECTPEAYLEGQTGGIPNREVALEELLLLWVANKNPAFAPFRELFDDSDLENHSAYSRVIEGLYDLLRGKPRFGPDDEHLIDMLRRPAIAVPHSLSGQLRYIRERWGMLLGRFILRLLSGLDLVREEEARSGWGGPGPGPSEVVSYEGLEVEHEQFSPDREWMPNVVLLAKSTLVWLDQLSKRYGRRIAKLSEVPDEELDRLAAQGFTGLWLIGLWQRSNASRRIKQICGNPEADASAYSIDSYSIAEELGGWDALHTLRERCWRRGIRLASDMVPNHTGIDSRWVIDHPERFIQAPQPPFPSYRYSGENLSPVSRVGIFLEDHYFSKSDAAVTFKRIDYQSGEVRYIYHGNDGTHTPWNDTAQINFLDPDTREAVIQTILHVAQNFPIIRFDAAMTLAKRHIQRLWYPEPGSGGAIPSRSEYCMTKAELDRAIPVEFWREVVDRVASELPDTLLLAEAFWMMEGYFVRTLGMHRVYNSAFMNMLKTEDNASYRTMIRNTLEFDPGILKRFVNFMNNPDEETALAQFGTGDKYFGVCTMMVTMPGLPMFGHGQIEGLSEKYGMEYRRAYREEVPDAELIRRHEREIFPLMKRRHLFAEVDLFRLFDFIRSDGSINENVFAYSNGVDGIRTLIVYNNSMERAAGWINRTVPFIRKVDGDGKSLHSETLGAALGLHPANDRYLILSEVRSGLSYLRSSKELEERGLYLELSGYQTQAFLNLVEVQDPEHHHYARLAAKLGGRGVPNIERALTEIFLEPLHQAFAAFMNGETLSELAAGAAPAGAAAAAAGPTAAAGAGPAAASEETGGSPPSRAGANSVPSALPDQLRERLRAAYDSFLRIGSDYSGGRFRSEIIDQMERSVVAVRKLLSFAAEAPSPDQPAPRSHAAGERTKSGSGFADYLKVGLQLNPYAPQLLLAVALLKPIGAVLPGEVAAQSRSLIDDWHLTSTCEAALHGVGGAQDLIARSLGVMKVLVRQQSWLSDLPSSEPGALAMIRFLADEEIQRYLGVNRFEETLWFNREAYLDFVWWMSAAAVMDLLEHESADARAVVAPVFGIVQDWLRLLDESSYRVEKLAESLRSLRRTAAGRGSRGGGPAALGRGDPATESGDAR